MTDRLGEGLDAAGVEEEDEAEDVEVGEVGAVEAELVEIRTD